MQGRSYNRNVGVDIHGRAHVKLLFAAALSVKSYIVHDIFPQWHRILAQSRSADLRERKQRIIDERCREPEVGFDIEAFRPQNANILPVLTPYLKTESQQAPPTDRLESVAQSPQLSQAKRLSKRKSSVPLTWILFLFKMCGYSCNHLLIRS